MIKHYFEESRDLFTSLILVLPLFIAYQLGVLLTGGVRNGVDFASDFLWTLASNQLLYYIGINLGILLVFIIAIFFMRKKGKFNPKLWPLVIGESTLYALIFGSVIIYLMQSLGLDRLLASGVKDFGIYSSLVMSIGAGLYEEIVFRLFLMGGIFWGLNKIPFVPTFVAAISAVLFSSFIFSGIHYVGNMADVFTLGSFSFRFFAGVVLAAIFYVRGFAVAVYTHAIYDIIVMVFK